ncbi:MAG: hypothetical protein WD381_06290 [Balneolaceae bacterium]
MIAFFPNSIFFGYHTVALEKVFFDGILQEGTSEIRTFFFGIIGGTIAGYFFLQTMIVRFSFLHREKWAWYAIFWAILLWFVTDSTISILHGAYFNVWMINIPSFLLVVTPLVMTFRQFKQSTTKEFESD